MRKICCTEKTVKCINNLKSVEYDIFVESEICKIPNDSKNHKSSVQIKKYRRNKKLFSLRNWEK